MSSTSPRVSTGVAGLITTPARHPWLLIKCSVRSRWRQASWCTEIQSAPASANAGINSSGFSIIRWQSSGNFVTLRSDFTTGGPIVRFGTKCPSIISTWTTLPPPSPAARTCSPRRAKSAERIEGASSINVGLSQGTSARNSNTLEALILAPGLCDNHSLDSQDALLAFDPNFCVLSDSSCDLTMGDNFGTGL